MNKKGIPEEDYLISSYEDVKRHYSSQGHTLIVSHIGNVSQEIIISITYFIENQLDISGENKTVIKKICNIAIEALQNILFHAQKNKEGFHLAYFIVGKEDSDYIIHSCNHIRNEDVDPINENLAKIKGMDMKRLNNLYIKKLSKGIISDKGRGGLGLMTIAMKADNNLSCYIQSTSDDYSIFSIKATVKV